MSDPRRPHPQPESPSELLACAAPQFGDKRALVHAGRTFTYNELDQISRAVAVGLCRQGVGVGDVVSLCGQNSWQWLIAYHAILRCGAIVNPLNVMLSEPELVHALNDCRARAVLADAERALVITGLAAQLPNLELVLPFSDTHPHGVDGLTTAIDDGFDESLPAFLPDPASMCAIAYTSGTTGYPKGAMQSQHSVLLNWTQTAAMHERDETDIVVTALPAFHVYGNVAINSTLLTGGTIVLMSRFDAREALRLISAHRATTFEGVPTMYALLMAEPAIELTDLTSLRKSTAGGQTLPVDVAQRWQQRTGTRLLELWGMTELSGLGATHRPTGPDVLGSIGMPLAGLEMKIETPRETDAAVTSGERGELMVRGPLVMMGYLGDPEATSDVLDGQGWLRTGDVAYRDSHGYYYIVDRVKDVILTGGYNVYPAELERVISGHPDVAMVAVGKRPDPLRGEIAVAYIVTRAPGHLDAQKVIDFCTPRLAAYKRPRAVVFVDKLPLTASGKVIRHRLDTLDA